MPAEPKKKWTILVWMAGDNDLEPAGDADIAELKKTGSTADVDVVVQLDRMSDHQTRRYHLRLGTTADADVVETLGETNTGDPAVAADFFVWGMTKYPAAHVLAILWNHGGGIDETDVYRRAAAIGISVDRRAQPTKSTLPRSRTRSMVSRRYGRSLFSTTIDAALRTRAIAFDDTSRDFLDNAELKKVLETVTAKTGRKVDVVGFDACLMSMAEVAFQVRASADLVVASEETEPNDGWPYDAILADLAAKPSMTPTELGKAIVRRYVASYKSEVTMALLDVDRGPALAKAVRALGSTLAEAIAAPGEYAAVTKAIRSAQRYYYRDFVDLYDLCDQLSQRVKSARVKAAARATQEALTGPKPFVAAEAHKGATVVGSHGAAIYVPMGDTSVAYAGLDFAKSSGWGKFITAYQKA